MSARWILTLLSVLLPASSFAQQHKRLELSAFTGGLYVSHELGTASNVFFATTGEAADVGLPKWYGFRVGLNITPNVGLEGSASRGNHSYRFSVQDNELGDVSLGEQMEATERTFAGNLILQRPMRYGLTPFGTVGVGWSRTKPDSEIHGVDTVSTLDFNLGFGVKYFFEDQYLSWLGVRLDVRWHFVDEGLAFSGESVSPRSTEVVIGAVLRPF